MFKTDLTSLENELKQRKDMYDLKEKYKIKRPQTSKIIAYIVLFFIMIIDAYFIFYLVPQSGILGITEYAFTALQVVLIGINASIFTFLVSFLVKSGWETHSQAQDTNETLKITTDNSMIDVVNSVKETVEAIKDTINTTTN